jgi:hypothetical protein
VNRQARLGALSGWPPAVVSCNVGSHGVVAGLYAQANTAVNRGCVVVLGSVQTTMPVGITPNRRRVAYQAVRQVKRTPALTSDSTDNERHVKSPVHICFARRLGHERFAAPCRRYPQSRGVRVESQTNQIAALSRPDNSAHDAERHSGEREYPAARLLLDRSWGKGRSCD